ncbi:MAG: exodeoxyribonuclease III [Legionellales bacterium]|nr:MAG: exodeoxyribonuclease III [Legionellales bacterium]
MRIISVNVNGIRATAKKGFFTWLADQDADIICLQEIKAHRDQLVDSIFYPTGYEHYFFSAEKKGYSGVAVYSKHKPTNVSTGLGWEMADTEGRYLQLDFGNLSVASIYVPSGTSSTERQELKYDFLQRYEKILSKQLKESRDYIICGDVNIVHQEIDIKNWRNNQKNSGCLPEERAWLDKLFNEIGYIDTFREKYPDKIQYTWWSNRANSWNNNVGWRIDYQLATPGLKDKIIEATVYREQQFSDHAPLIVDYDYIISL